jgi:ABC-type transporter Mla subunit MlaD
MVTPVVKSQIANATKGISSISLERINTALESVNENLKKIDLKLPNISSANITGQLQNLDLNLTESLNDDLLKTINEATGAISGLPDAFNNVIGGFSDQLSGLAGKIGDLNKISSQLGSITGQLDNLLDINTDLKIPGLDQLNELTASLDGFLQEAQGLLSELGNFDNALSNLVDSSVGETLQNLVDKTAANPDFIVDAFNMETVKSRDLATPLIDGSKLQDGSIFKIESTREYFVVENGQQVSLWDYNVNRARNGQRPFKPAGAITDRVVSGVPIYKSAQ